VVVVPALVHFVDLGGDHGFWAVRVSSSMNFDIG